MAQNNRRPCDGRAVTLSSSAGSWIAVQRIASGGACLDGRWSPSALQDPCQLTPPFCANGPPSWSARTRAHAHARSVPPPQAQAQPKLSPHSIHLQLLVPMAREARGPGDPHDVKSPFACTENSRSQTTACNAQDAAYDTLLGGMCGFALLTAAAGDAAPAQRPECPPPSALWPLPFALCPLPAAAALLPHIPPLSHQCMHIRWA